MRLFNGCDDEETPDDERRYWSGGGAAGLDGFRVLDAIETPGELVVTIETDAELVGCTTCGVRAETHDRMPVEIRDLACFGRPARLVWRKRRWRCVEPACDAKTWTEQSDHVDAQAVKDRGLV